MDASRVVLTENGVKEFFKDRFKKSFANVGFKIHDHNFYIDFNDVSQDVIDFSKELRDNKCIEIKKFMVEKGLVERVQENDDWMKKGDELDQYEPYEFPEEMFENIGNYDLIILVGVSHSGKSTFCREVKKEVGDFCVRVNRDDIRLMVLGKDDDGSFAYDPMVEEVIKINQFELIQKLFDSGHTVIADNTHLGKKDVIEYFSRFFNKYSIGVVVFDEQYCKSRNAISKKLTEEAIKWQLDSFETNYPEKKFKRNKIYNAKKYLNLYNSPKEKEEE